MGAKAVQTKKAVKPMSKMKSGQGCVVYSHRQLLISNILTIGITVWMGNDKLA